MTIDATSIVNGHQVDGDGFIVTPEQPQETVVSQEQIAVNSSEPPKKRRGRPPNSSKLGGPESVSSSSASAKAKAKAKTSFSASDYETMGKQIVGMHEMAAMVTGLPMLRVTLEEGTAVAKALADVGEQYGLAIDGKTGATINLVLTLGMVYGPRLLHIKQARNQAAQQQAANTFENGQPAVS